MSGGTNRDELVRPDMHEVVQDEQLDHNMVMTTVPVRIDGPVQVQDVPAVGGVLRGITLTTTPEMISGRDPRRQLLRLDVAAAAYIGFTKIDVDPTQSPTGFPVRANSSITIRTQDAIWAAAATGTVSAGLQIERWAD